MAFLPLYLFFLYLQTHALTVELSTLKYAYVNNF